MLRTEGQGSIHQAKTEGTGVLTEAAACAKALQQEITPSKAGDDAGEVGGSQAMLKSWPL